MTTVPQIDMYGHPQFFATVTKTAACARDKMPDAEARIIRAASLVLNGQVRAHTVCTNAWIVASESRQDIEYDVVENTCTCTDYARHAATTSGYACKHIISVWLYRRVEQKLAALPIVPVATCLAPIDDQGTPCHAVQDDCVHDSVWRTPAVTPVGQSGALVTPLPEAPASANCYILVRGHRVQLTVRGYREEEVLERLEHILDRYAPVSDR